MAEFSLDSACDHLFIAMVGNVGSGVTTSSDIIGKKLKNIYGYEVHYIRVSNFIESSHIGKNAGLDGLSDEEKVEAYQNIGNELRKKFGDSFLASRCIDEAINKITSHNRIAFIFDSFKHPEEIALLRQCFEERLITFTVFCPSRIRKKRLETKGISEKTIATIFDRDEFELDKHGQKVRETAYLSDFFIRNSDENKVSITKTIERYLEIIFSIKVHTPNFDEIGMAKAFGAASASACLSRQVGAAVYDSNRKLLATGCNDVPKFGGGLYSESDSLENDHRCFNWQNGDCHNDLEKSIIYNELVNSLVPEKLLRSSKLNIRDEIINSIKSTRVKDLIEFSRSVHAEMDALVSVSRHGTGSTLNGTLFSKTFPCHNCARHIVAAGIKRVVYVEPY